MTTNVCDARYKCIIWLDNYKYLLKYTCFQTFPMLCIQFYFEVEDIHQRNLGQSFFIYIMSKYPYPQNFCKTPLDLDLYLFIQKKELKNVDEEFQTKVGY
jgi:hypothetical protein